MVKSRRKAYDFNWLNLDQINNSEERKKCLTKN